MHASGAVGTVATSQDSVCPLKVGARVPDLSLTTPDGKKFNLNNAFRKHPAVLIFYRGGWCPYCNTQLGELATIESRLIELGYQILAVSPDRPEKLRESIAKHKLSYQLLSDSDTKAIRAFGLAFTLDEDAVKKLKGYGIDIEASSGSKDHVLPVPAVFLVNREGTVVFQYANPDYKVRLKPEILLSAAAAYAAPADPPNTKR
ncbi:MAG: AhpC/TSA family protein [Deltaproteobacteria bacterium]|nr:AhpC/TSA family protein [Deltaproteobacteria bacterium]